MSQYKIESQISLVNQLTRIFDIQTEKLNNMNIKSFDDPELIQEMEILDTMRNTLVEQEEILKKMQEEFDDKIHPLPQVGGYDGQPLFKMTVPNDGRNHIERIKEYANFIVVLGYYVNSMDKQKGYISTVYTFFVSRSE